MHTIDEAEVALSDYQDFQDAYQQIGRLLNGVYNRKHVHSRLGYLTPAEFEASMLPQHLAIAVCVP
jgi:putative transposase